MQLPSAAEFWLLNTSLVVCFCSGVKAEVVQFTGKGLEVVNSICL